MTNEILILTKTDIILSYLAGFFDGEGSVGIYSSGNTYRNCCLRVQLKQNQNPHTIIIFDFLYSNYGGFTSKVETGKGKICLTWAASGDKAVNFLKDILQFSIIKNEQIKLCIEWQIGRKNTPRDLNGRLLKKEEEEIKRDIYFSNKVRLLKDTPLGKPYKTLKGKTSEKGCKKWTKKENK